MSDLPTETFTAAYESDVKKIIHMASKAQIDKFREAAQIAEADTDEKRFDEKLKRIAKAPPKSDKSKDKKPAK